MGGNKAAEDLDGGLTTNAPPIPAHFAYVQHGKGDDTRLAFVKASVMRGWIICRIERRPGEQSQLGGRGPLLVLHKREDRIVRAATNIDLDEVCTLAGILAERGIDRKVLQEAIPR